MKDDQWKKGRLDAHGHRELPQDQQNENEQKAAKAPETDTYWRGYAHGLEELQAMVW